MSERLKRSEEEGIENFPFNIEGPLADLAKEVLEPGFRKALSEYRRARDKLVEEARMKQGGGHVGLTEEEVGELLSEFGLKDALSAQRSE